MQYSSAWTKQFTNICASIAEGLNRVRCNGGLHGIIVSFVPDDGNIADTCGKNWFGSVQCFGSGCVHPTTIYRLNHANSIAGFACQ